MDMCDLPDADGIAVALSQFRASLGAVVGAPLGGALCFGSALFFGPALLFAFLLGAGSGLPGGFGLAVLLLFAGPFGRCGAGPASAVDGSGFGGGLQLAAQ